MSRFNVVTEGSAAHRWEITRIRDNGRERFYRYSVEGWNTDEGGEPYAFTQTVPNISDPRYVPHETADADVRAAIALARARVSR